MFSACTFQSQAEVYSEMHEAGDRSRLGIFSPTFKRQNIIGENDWKLNATRLEDSWFLCQLVEKFTESRTIHEQNFNIFTEIDVTLNNCASRLCEVLIHRHQNGCIMSATFQVASKA